MYQGGCLNEAIIYDTVHTEAQIKDYTKALNKKWQIYKTDSDNLTYKSQTQGGSYISSSTALALPTGLGNKICHYNSDPSNVSGAASITLSDGTTLTRILLIQMILLVVMEPSQQHIYIIKLMLLIMLFSISLFYQIMHSNQHLLLQVILPI